MVKVLFGIAILAAGALLVGSGGGGLDSIGTTSAEISVGEVSMGTFQAVTTPCFSTEVQEVVDPMLGTKKFPGPVRVGPIVLEVGYAQGDALLQWRKEVEASADNPVDPLQPSATKDGTLTIRDDAGKVIAKYNFTGAWPSKLKGMTIVRSGYVARVIDHLELSFNFIARIDE